MLRSIVLLCSFAAAVAAEPLDSATLRKMEAFGAKWWQARPKTPFHARDASKHAALVKQAKAFGAIPEGSLDAVRDVLWKSVKKHGPKGKGRAKMKIIGHGYKGDMWAMVKGGGKNKGLAIGLHTGGVGSGDAALEFMFRGCINVAPQGLNLHSDDWNTVHGEKQVLALIEIAKAQWNIDPDRVYICGKGSGGTGAWHMAGRFADLFAGAAPGTGVFMASPKSQAARREDVHQIQYGLVPNVRNLAVYAFSGLKNTVCMPGTYLFAANLVEELKFDDKDGWSKFRLEMHKSSTEMFPPGEPAKAIKWLSQHRRDAFPRKIVWEYAKAPYPLPDGLDSTTRYQQHWFYWLHHTDRADKVVFTAARDGNAFTIDTEGENTEGLYLMLNPTMIDVTNEVVVTLNGKEFYRGQPQPDFWTVLQSLDSKLDKTLVFDRRVPLFK